MENDIVIDASFVPVSEVLSQTIFAIFDSVNSAKEVLIHKENFNVFATYLDRISSVLDELSKKNIEHSEGLLVNALEIVKREVEVAKRLALDCRKKNKVYLLMNCRSIVKALESCTKDIGRALSLLSLPPLEVSLSLNNQISNLCKNMLDAEYSKSVPEEDILEKIELGMREGNVAPSKTDDLLLRIADTIGISNEHSELKREFEEFKSGLEDTYVIKGSEEDLQKEMVSHIIALLDKTNADTDAAEEKADEYSERTVSLGRQPLEPLRQFYCPLSQEIMVDPVETSTQQTFERTAIEKWFAQGKNVCPLTDTPLDTSVLRPNKALKRLIEEWRDRNTRITIASIKPTLQSSEDQEVLKSLHKLQNLCAESDIHQEWVTMEGYIPALVELLVTKNREIRKNSLVILSILAKDSEENKERITAVDNALKAIVRSLARQSGESKVALQLLLELSRSRVARDLMGDVRGCILLLGTLMLSSEDDEVTGYAEEVLENLSCIDQNVIQMARANYFKPLLNLLSSGTKDVQMVMVETLSEIELTDHNKLSIVKDGALEPLLELLSNPDLEKRKVSVKALLRLSSLPQNGLEMIRKGTFRPLLELLYSQSLSPPALREQVAETIMHLAISTTTKEATENHVSLLDSEDDVFKLFSLISLTGPDIQRSILRTFRAMCQSSSGLDFRIKLRQMSAFQVLVHLCEADSLTVRADAIKLFSCLTEVDDDSTFSEHISQRCIHSLLRIVETSTDVEETAAAMGIIANLPKDQLQIICWLLDAEALHIIWTCLSDANRDASYKRQLVENAVGALIHFTTASNQEWQMKVSQTGLIPILVQLLASGTSLTKQNAAISLKQLSESSKSLSKPIKRGVFQCCFSAPELGCAAHFGICTVESSFCLLKAKALEPLVRMLTEPDVGACEASLNALLTLLVDERLEQGGKVLDDAKAIGLIVKLLSSQSARLQRKSLMALERIFEVNVLTLKYGTLAHMALVDIAQKKDNDMKSLAAKVLGQLGVLGNQSSYF